MRSKRTIAALSLLVGLGVGAVAGALVGGGSAAAARPRIVTHRCLPGASGVVSALVLVHNLTGREITVTERLLDEDGNPDDPTLFTLGPRQTAARSPLSEVSVAEYSSRSRIILDGFSRYDPGPASDETERQIKCT